MDMDKARRIVRQILAEGLVEQVPAPTQSPDQQPAQAPQGAADREEADDLKRQQDLQAKHDREIRELSQRQQGERAQGQSMDHGELWDLKQRHVREQKQLKDRQILERRRSLSRRQREAVERLASEYSGDIYARDAVNGLMQKYQRGDPLSGTSEDVSLAAQLEFLMTVMTVQQLEGVLDKEQGPLPMLKKAGKVFGIPITPSA